MPIIPQPAKCSQAAGAEGVCSSRRQAPRKPATLSTMETE